MQNLKFVCREKELEFAKSAIQNNDFIVYHYFNNSGLTHYLKKLQLDLCSEGNICFYLDCQNENKIAVQIAQQILSGNNQPQLVKHIKKKKRNEVTKSIIKSLATSIDVIPFVNLGEIAFNLIDAIVDTTDVDIEHISDYKVEKAIVKMITKLSESGKYNSICFLFDNTNQLSTSSLDFIAKLISIKHIKIMFTISNNSNLVGMEALSKLSHIDFTPYEIKKIFERPDDRLIYGLFHCYNKECNENIIDIFEQHERNIHIIMSYIRGFNMNFNELDNITLCVLKILLIADTYINIDVLRCIFNRRYYRTELFSNEEFDQLINKLTSLSFIYVDLNNNVFLNTKLITNADIYISLIEKITITRDILSVFENIKSDLSIQQLKFAVNNLDKDYSRRKSYLLLLLDKQNRNNCIEQQYLDMLFSLDNKEELLKVCSMYYNLQIYDVPFIRINQHSLYLKDRDCQILRSLLCERLHYGNYSKSLDELVKTSRNIDEKCLLIAILFTALFNEGESVESMKILQDSSSGNYYKKFFKSKYYSFLLRNVSYYIEDVETAIMNYKYCLSKFKNSDPVNYNRTMSNFIGYLMKNDFNPIAKTQLELVIPEVEKILEFNDPKYLYLNINYGIYLIKSNTGDPTKYFDSIVFEAGTTETPYIYSQINLALYISKKDPVEALTKLDEIYYNHIKNSNVIPTKTYYQINRILVEYMNNINDFELLNELKLNPLRGDTNYAEYLYSTYNYKFQNNIKYQKDDWDKLFLPGYIFYHGFNAELLLSIFESPS